MFWMLIKRTAPWHLNEHPQLSFLNKKNKQKKQQLFWLPLRAFVKGAA